MNIFRKLWNRIVDAAAETVGDVENKTRKPLYGISEYTYVVDDRLTRGAWPDKNMLFTLKAMGFSTVVNLCSERDQDKQVRAIGLTPINIPIKDNTIPFTLQVDAFMRIMKTSPGRTYVHCEQGKGRTGCMVAAYRVIAQKWNPIDALVEAKRFGLSLPNQQQFILKLKA